jgi:hypothetical protein
MKRESYEELVKGLIKSAKLVDHSRDPCEEGVFPTREDKDKVIIIINFIVYNRDIYIEGRRTASAQMAKLGIEPTTLLLA